MSSFSASKLKLGVLGGGQLGRMLIQKAIDFNIPVHVLDPDADAPCKNIADVFVQGDFRDFDTVISFGQSADLITVEIEHVNTEALDELEKQGKLVYPQPKILKMIQDKGMQKEFYRIHSIPTSEFRLVNNKSEIAAFENLFPVMQKTRKAGYDGKGVKPLRNVSDINDAFDEPAVIEKFVDMQCEISVIVSRNIDGKVAAYPPVEMEFNAEANLVEFLYSPSSIDEKVAAKATAIATKLISELGMVGLLAVEMFVTREGEVLVNEIAPRPHNSGHQTIEGNITSQYEQHLRAILNLPPGDTAILLPSVMVNLLGEKGYTGEAVYEGFSEAMQIPGAHIHLYGKRYTKPFRKMGHVTVTGNTLDAAIAGARKVQDLLKVKT